MSQNRKIKGKTLYLHKLSIKGVVHHPNKFNIKSKNKNSNTTGVLADWYNGTIEARGEYGTYFFQIRQGQVIDFTTPNGTSTHLAKMHNNYVTFYFRLKEDQITYQNKTGRLASSVSRLSPIFGYYNNDLLKWPYNWENIKKSGAPSCSWSIKNNKFYLSGLELHFGLAFAGPDKEKLSLKKEFPDKVKNNQVFADWVNGVYLISFGKMQADKYDYKRFKTSSYTFLRIKKGLIVEAHNVEANFNFRNIPKGTDPKVKKIITEFMNN